MSLDEALASGAMALFGEKYGEQVRVVSVPEFSTELCGGTHVEATGEIGLFKIVAQGGVAAGVRRIEAVTGPGAYQHVKREAQVLTETAARLKARPLELVDKVEKLAETSRDLEREVQRLQARLLGGTLERLLAGAVGRGRGPRGGGAGRGDGLQGDAGAGRSRCGTGCRVAWSLSPCTGTARSRG